MRGVKVELCQMYILRVGPNLFYLLQLIFVDRAFIGNPLYLHFDSSLMSKLIWISQKIHQNLIEFSRVDIEPFGDTWVNEHMQWVFCILEVWNVSLDHFPNLLSDLHLPQTDFQLIRIYFSGVQNVVDLAQ